MKYLHRPRIILELGKYKKADVIFFLSACLWMILSAETIGFVLFFDSGNFYRMLIGIIPFLLGNGVLFSIQTDIKLIDSVTKKFLLVPLSILIGIGSYIYKPTTEEVNCWFYIDNGKTYNVLFAEVPGRTFEVQLSSYELKK